jgi:acetyl esterase
MSLILDRRNTALDRRDTNDIIRTAGFTPDISLSARLCFGDNAAVVGGAGHRQAAIAGAARGPYCVAVSSMRTRMITPLDPVIAEIIPLLPLRDPATMTPQSARDALRALAAARAAVPPPPVMSANDTRVQGAAGPLAARVYRNTDGKSPTVVFFHGGGWVAGDLETHDRQARLLAIETGAVVISVDYRRPPETRFPGAFEDALAAVKDIVGRIAEFGGDAARVGVAGDSAGGNLAAVTAIACRDAGIRLAAQLLVYPVTDVAGNYADREQNARFPSRAENAEGYFLSRVVMQWFAGHYLADAGQGTDWRVSPLRAKNLAGLAPAIVCTAWFDPLRDEGKAYADALAAAGVATKYYEGAGLIHGYFGLGEASETAKREAQRARADFKALLDGGA